MQSLYTAASGLSNQQKRLDTIASNIANASTTGYKSTRVDFKDALYSTMEDPVLADGAENNLLAGSGVLLDATSIDFQQGSITQTGQPLDFAVEGSGFFQVQNENGETLYTRSGSFCVTNVDNENYLVTPQGYFVLDLSGDRIKLPDASGNLTVTEKGVIEADGKEYGTLGLVGFANPDGLSPAGDTCYRATDNSGLPEKDLDSGIIQGSVETSNVNLAQELTMLIRSQRAFSLASRALTTTDDMMGLANTIH